jgi:hypothetical protein
MSEVERRRVLARDRQRRRRDRLRLIECDARDITPLPTLCDPLLRVTLGVVGVTLGVTGAAMNGWFAWSLGTDVVSRVVFCALGVANDVAVLLLPSVAVQRRWAWVVWLVCFALAVFGGNGFVATNITDAKSARPSAVVADALRAVGNAERAVALECTRLGPVCRQRQSELHEASQALRAARAQAEADGDPQAQAVARLVRWDADGVAMVRLALLTLLPQLGGVLLALAGMRIACHSNH